MARRKVQCIQLKVSTLIFESQLALTISLNIPVYSSLVFASSSILIYSSVSDFLNFSLYSFLSSYFAF